MNRPAPRLALPGLVLAVTLALAPTRGRVPAVDRAPAPPPSPDLDHSPWAAWTAVPGIGPTLGRRIVLDRALRGPFATARDARRVPGIGPRTVESIAEWIAPGEVR